MRNATILFADNDESYLRIRQKFLEQEGYKVNTSTNPVDAKRILENEKIDLAILDIRLLNDNDEKDISGLVLAKETAPLVPKIILTGFPTYDAVREALGPNMDGIPPAVDFIAKQEGPEIMLRAVRLAFFMMLRPDLQSNLLHAFETQSIMDLPNQINLLGSEEASHRLHRSFDDTTRQLTEYREQENRRASRYHSVGLLISAIGMLFVFTSIILMFLGYVTFTRLPLIASVISEAVSILFFVREDAAYKRVNMYFSQLNELNNLGNLLTICDSLVIPTDRDEYKKKIIDIVVEKWFKS